MSPLEEEFFGALIEKTNNFGSLTWLGQPIWQNLLDLWTIQETIAEVKPGLLIECGTYRGGSALFYAQLFDHLGRGEVVTVDLTTQHAVTHSRITFLTGDSTSAEIVDEVRRRASTADGPVMVILDSEHSCSHVLRELACYTPLVSPGSYCLVQDGIIDLLPALSPGRPGPLAAIEEFMKNPGEFEVDHERCNRFLITHHPQGWLRRKAGAVSLSR